MKVFLLSALACLVFATEEPLSFSGKFHTIYLASEYVPLIEENSEVRLLMREVKIFKKYRLMSMTFYVRKNGMCQLHTVLLDKINDCLEKFTALYAFLQCTVKNRREKVLGVWVLHNANLHFPHIYSTPRVMGGRTRRSTSFYVWLNFVSNTTILFKANFRNSLGNTEVLTAALAKGTNITEEMWEKYVKMTQDYKIPTENIKNIYEAGESVSVN
ncbi:hypothetical protein ACRRTK_005383 [Alexandromys fortis]